MVVKQQKEQKRGTMISPVRLPVALMLLTLSPLHVTHIKIFRKKSRTGHLDQSVESYFVCYLTLYIFNQMRWIWLFGGTVLVKAKLHADICPCVCHISLCSLLL